MEPKIDQPNEIQDPKKVRNETLKKNNEWVKVLKKAYENRGYFCTVKNENTYKGTPKRVLTFEYTIDSKKFKVVNDIQLLTGKINVSIDTQVVTDTSIKEYDDAKKFGEKILDYLPFFFENHYEGNDINTEETTVKSTAMTTTNNEVQTTNQNTQVKTQNNSLIDLGDGNIIDAEVLKTEAYNIRMNNLNKLNEVFKNLLT